MKLLFDIVVQCCTFEKIKIMKKLTCREIITLIQVHVGYPVTFEKDIPNLLSYKLIENYKHVHIKHTELFTTNFGDSLINYFVSTTNLISNNES